MSEFWVLWLIVKLKLQILFYSLQSPNHWIRNSYMKAYLFPKNLDISIQNIIWKNCLFWKILNFIYFSKDLIAEFLKIYPVSKGVFKEVLELSLRKWLALRNRLLSISEIIKLLLDIVEIKQRPLRKRCYTFLKFINSRLLVSLKDLIVHCVPNVDEFVTTLLDVLIHGKRVNFISDEDNKIALGVSILLCW